MNNTKFQKILEQLYNKYEFIGKRTTKTVNELVYVLRMYGTLMGVNFQLNIGSKNMFMCIPGVLDSFIPTKTLARNITSVKFDEEAYNEFGIYLVLVEVED